MKRLQSVRTLAAFIANLVSAPAAAVRSRKTCRARPWLGVVIASSLLPATAAQAVTKNWNNNNTANAFWNTGNNWSPAGVPGTVTADAVNIIHADGAGRTITYDYTGPAVTLNSLNLNLTGVGVASNTILMAANNLTSSYELIGNSGRGIFDQSGGTNTIAAGVGYLAVGDLAGATGVYILSGTGVLVANTNEYIGNSGTGFFNLNGGTNTINGVASNLYVGGDVGANGNYTLNSGALQVTSGDENIGLSGSGAFIQNGGVNTVALALKLGVGSPATGSYTLSGGALSCNSEVLSTFGSSAFNQTGGTNSVATKLDVGFNGTATYNLGGTGALSTASERIGYHGSGTMNQTGGTHTVTGILEMGADSNASKSGIYTLSGGQASIGSNAYIGGLAASGEGKGVLSVSGTGVLTVGGALTVYNTAGTALNLSGGTINAAALNFGGVPTLFNWTGGQLNLNSNVVWDSAAAASSTSAAFGSSRGLSSGQTLMITGNETLGGTGVFSLTLNNGSTHAVTGGLVIAPGGTLTQIGGSTLTYSTLTLAGGAFNGTLQNLTTFNYQSGLFNGRLLNQGTVSLGANFVAQDGVGNDTTMTVAGGQTLTTNGAGLDNHGLFTVASGGSLVATTVTNQSEFVVNGSATATTFTNSALLHGVGQVTAAVTNAANGDVRIVAGERLRFAGASFTNQGLVEAIGSSASPAEVEFNSPVTNATANGLIAGSNSLYRFNSGLMNQASLALSIGTNNVLGDITNSATGKIVVSGGAGTTFYDDIVQNGTFRVSKVGSTTSVAVVLGAFSGSGGSTGGGDIFFEGDLRPGNSPATVTFDNNVSFGSGASIDIELGGTTPGNQFDQVKVSRELALDGALQVSLINNFTPVAGQAFDILDWGSLSGTFASIDLPTLAGLTWNTSHLYTTGAISVGLAGDYSNNGAVDAADYVVWRKRLGTTYTQNDYNVWRANFGAVAGSGSGSNFPEAQASVPEPTTLVLFAVGAIYLLAVGNVRHSRGLSILFGVAVSVSSVSARADVFYVASYNSPGEIDKVSSAGGVSIFASLPADSYYPEGLAFDVSGNLYVANDSNGRISKISSSGTVSLFATVSSLPVGLAFDVSGNLYVVNNGHDQIDKITPSGTVSFFAALPADSNAVGLAFDSNGNLYVADSNIDQISKITSSGTSSIFVTLPSGSSPWSLAFDGSGNLYVSEPNGRIDKITSGGAVSHFATLPDHPYGLAFDSSGNLYASGYGLGQISKITAAGAVSIFASDIVSPTFIAVTDDAGQPLSLPRATLLGDYNRNGTVDAADYTVWRDGLGSVYNQADYQVWRTHFGETSGSGSSASANTSVPEPAALVLLMFAAAGWCLRRGRAAA